MTVEFKRLLVPLDGSPDAEGALRVAMPLFRSGSAEIFLLTVSQEPDAGPYLERVCGDLKAQGIRAGFELRRGLPADEIVKYARESRVDLVAMSTHGRSGVSRLRWGSVTEEVLRRAEQPLLICPPGTTLPERKRIVVALDGSERAEEILSYATAAARALKAPVHVVEVTLPLMATGEFGLFPVSFPPEDAQPYLTDVCRRLAGEGIAAQPVALEGRAASEVLHYAGQMDAGLICMTTHGRTGLSRFVLGSIAEEVLRHAPCPVLVRRVLVLPQPVV